MNVYCFTCFVFNRISFARWIFIPHNFSALPFHDDPWPAVCRRTKSASRMKTWITWKHESNACRDFNFNYKRINSLSLKFIGAFLLFALPRAMLLWPFFLPGNLSPSLPCRASINFPQPSEFQFRWINKWHNRQVYTCVAWVNNIYRRFRQVKHWQSVSAIEMLAFTSERVHQRHECIQTIKSVHLWSPSHAQHSSPHSLAAVWECNLICPCFSVNMFPFLKRSVNN